MESPSASFLINGRALRLPRFIANELLKLALKDVRKVLSNNLTRT